jgi:hypothetical protein
MFHKPPGKLWNGTYDFQIIVFKQYKYKFLYYLEISLFKSIGVFETETFLTRTKEVYKFRKIIVIFDCFNVITGFAISHDDLELY